jgi:hypothetical protein
MAASTASDFFQSIHQRKGQSTISTLQDNGTYAGKVISHVSYKQ